MADHHKNLAQALLAIQKEMPAITPDSTNPHFRSKFVSLGKLLAKSKPIVNKHGVVVTQFPSKDADGQPTLVTALIHESGERLEYAAPLYLAKPDPMTQGSAITYMRRYALASALGVSDQEDDDGNAGSQVGSSSQPSTEPSPQQKAAITRRSNELALSDEDKRQLMEWAGGLPLTKAKASKLIELLKDSKDYHDVFKRAGIPKEIESDLPAEVDEPPPAPDGPDPFVEEKAAA